MPSGCSVGCPVPDERGVQRAQFGAVVARADQEQAGAVEIEIHQQVLAVRAPVGMIPAAAANRGDR